MKAKLKANELRIGNYYLSNNILSKVVEINEDYFIGIPVIPQARLNESKKHEPVPLTEEWLLKFGFREIDFGGRCFELNSVVLYPSEKYNFRLFAYGTNSLLYVHQLQNLYFAHTGEELTININQ